MPYSPDEHAFLNVADGIRRREQTLQGLVEQNAQLRAERDAYFKHLESSQATVLELRNELANQAASRGEYSRAMALAGDASVLTPKDSSVSSPAVQAANKTAPGAATPPGPTPTAEPLSECGNAVESTPETTNSTL